MLKKINRLAKTTAVQTALKAGRGFFNPNFNVRALLSTGEHAKFTVVVSTKVDKRAVKRNRIKRLIREFIRLRLSKFRKADYVIMIKPQAAKLDDEVLLQKLEEAFVRWRII